jgi:CBS domain-containing protein
MAIMAKETDGIDALPPFCAMPAERLTEILADAAVVFFRHGKVICHPEIAENGRRLWLVRRGSVHLTPFGDEPAYDASAERLGIGALLPLESALTGARPWCIYAAAEDSFLWEIDGESLEQLLAEPAVLRWIALQLQESNGRLRVAVSEMLRDRRAADQALALPVGVVAGDGVVCTATNTPLREVATLMADKAVGSVVIGSPDAVVGIVTQTDLVRRAMAAGLDYGSPVGTVMTSRPAMIASGATALDAGIEMAGRGFRHLLVCEPDGPVVGVVSERDIFRIQQRGAANFFLPIDAASSIDELADLAGRTRDFAQRVFRQGMEVSQFTRLMSSLNDRLTRRLLTIIAAELHSEQQFCWLAFGSEGREEQGFITDQDNGIIFVPTPTADIEAVRTRYLDSARRINDGLQRCGFDLCKGNIMAGNPEWCLSLDEWKERFSRWIRAPTPTAMLNATIFFDLRGVYGDINLAERLRDHLLDQILGNTICLHMLAANAVEVRPPLGKWSRFATDRGEAKGTFDLKTHGSRLFVDVARIYALANGVRTTNTEDRLRALGKRIRRSPTAIEGDIAAFRFIQTIRLRRQLDSLKDGKPVNRIDPYLLNDLDQGMLRESLRQARSLQERLKLDYQP